MYFRTNPLNDKEKPTFISNSITPNQRTKSKKVCTQLERIIEFEGEEYFDHCVNKIHTQNYINTI